MRIGFIGLGAMGRPMAENIARAGFQLTVFDVRPEPMTALAAFGATPAVSVQQVVEQSDVILLMVATESQIMETIGERDGGGLLSVASKGLTLVIHSTVHPDFCKRLAAKVGEYGVDVVDASVSGMETRAQDGTLTLLIGGRKETADRLTPLFQAIGKSIFYLGPVGSGMTIKIINNMVAAVNMAALREGLALADGCGIGEAAMLDVLNVSSGESALSRGWFPMQEAWRTQRKGGGPPWDLAVKDMDLALALGRSTGAEMPMAKLVSQLTGRFYAESKK